MLLLGGLLRRLVTAGEQARHFASAVNIGVHELDAVARHVLSAVSKPVSSAAQIDAALTVKLRQ